VLLFKVGDAFANKLFTPFMMDVGFSKTRSPSSSRRCSRQIAWFGSVLGGILMVRLGLLRSCSPSACLAGGEHLLYCALALAGKNWLIMVAAVTIEHLAAAYGWQSRWSRSSWRCADVRYSAFSKRCCRCWRCCALVVSGTGRLGCRSRRLVCYT